MITRSIPAVGYVDEEAYQVFGFTQNVRAGNTLYVSGVTPLRGGLANLELVGAGDLRTQTEQVMDVLERLLAAEGATFANWVEQTVYTTNMAELTKIAPEIFPARFGSNVPAQTWIEVKGLFHPEQMIEIKGVALLD